MQSALFFFFFAANAQPKQNRSTDNEHRFAKTFRCQHHQTGRTHKLRTPNKCAHHVDIFQQITDENSSTMTSSPKCGAHRSRSFVSPPMHRVNANYGRFHFGSRCALTIQALATTRTRSNERARRIRPRVERGLRAARLVTTAQLAWLRTRALAQKQTKRSPDDLTLSRRGSFRTR